MATLINEDKKLVYLHFKKTGGWLIYNILKDHGFKIIDLSKFGGHIGQEYFDKQYFTFGFIRHPVDWYISIFNFLNGHDFVLIAPRQSNKVIDISWAKTNTLDEFITKIRNGENVAFNLISEYVNFFGLNGDNNYCKLVYRYEEMFSCLNEVLLQFDIDISDKIDMMSKIKINQSDRKDTFISQDNLQYIYYSCDPIFNTFGYEKNNYWCLDS